MISIREDVIENIAKLETVAAVYTHTLCLLNQNKNKEIIINKRE